MDLEPIKTEANNLQFNKKKIKKKETVIDQRRLRKFNVASWIVSWNRKRTLAKKT